MGKLKIAVVGTGFIGALHARIIYECPQAELAAVADINGESAATVGAAYGCHSYTDLEQLLNMEETDAVDICTPEEYHLEAVRLAAAYGKHILLEKPAARTYQEALEIDRLAKTHDVRLMVAHLLHFDPRYVTLEEAVQRGELGEVVSMFFRRVNWKRTTRRLKGKVSFLYYMCVHDIEFMLSCNRETKPVKVYAQGVSKINAEVNQEDTAFLTVNFENGSLACIQVLWAMPENTAAILQTGAEVLGTAGMGYVDGRMQGVEIVTEQAVFHPDVLHWPEYNGRMQGDLKEEIHHFVDATLHEYPYLVDTGRAMEAVRIIEAALLSMKTGMPVTLLEEEV